MRSSQDVAGALRSGLQVVQTESLAGTAGTRASVRPRAESRKRLVTHGGLTDAVLWHVMVSG